MAYATSRFYSISELFNDDLRIMAHIIAINAKMDAKKIYKDLEFGRHKEEYVEVLEKVLQGLKQNPVKTYADTIKAIINPDDEIFKRDDFSNIEAYSVFKRQYNKQAKIRTSKKHKKNNKPKEYDWGLFKGLI